MWSYTYQQRLYLATWTKYGQDWLPDTSPYLLPRHTFLLATPNLFTEPIFQIALNFCTKLETFLFSKRPINFILNELRVWKIYRGVRPIIHLHLVQNLRMSGAYLDSPTHTHMVCT